MEVCCQMLRALVMYTCQRCSHVYCGWGWYCCWISGEMELSYRCSNMYNVIITLSRILANLADSQMQVKPMHIITWVLIIVTINKVTIYDAQSSATRNSLTTTESFCACHGCTVTTGTDQWGWGNSWHMWRCANLRGRSGAGWIITEHYIFKYIFWEWWIIPPVWINQNPFVKRKLFLHCK